MVPYEVLVYILDVGRFTPAELAPVRLVNRALRAAASEPSMYRDHVHVISEPPARVAYNEVSAWLAGYLESVPETVAPHLGGLVFPDRRLGRTPRHFPALLARFTSLTVLDLNAAGVSKVAEEGIDALPISLRVLNLGNSVREPAGTMGRLIRHLTRLEVLAARIAEPHVELPLDALSSLRRLDISRSYRLLLDEFLTALVGAPCAATLEALCLGSVVSAGRWWPHLTLLPSLRELALGAGGWHSENNDDDVDDYAQTLCSLTQLDVLHVCLNHSRTAEAVWRCGLPPVSTLGVEYFVHDDDGGATTAAKVVAVLPRGLRNLDVLAYDTTKAWDDRAISQVLERCPDLAVLKMFHPVSATGVAALAAYASADRYLSVSGKGFDEEGKAALRAAGHAVQMVDIGVHWRLPGGIHFLDQDQEPEVGRRSKDNLITRY